MSISEPPEALHFLGDVRPEDPTVWLDGLRRLALDWEVRLASRIQTVWRRSDGAALVQLDTGWVWAGPPNPRPQLSAFWQALDWALPKALGDLYAVHDGIGPISGARAIHWRDAVRAAECLEPLQARVRFGATSTFATGDVLLFSPDGKGGGWCLARGYEAGRGPGLLHFDGARHTLSRGPELLAFLRALPQSW